MANNKKYIDFNKVFSENGAPLTDEEQSQLYDLIAPNQNKQQIVKLARTKTTTHAILDSDTSENQTVELSHSVLVVGELAYIFRKGNAKDNLDANNQKLGGGAFGNVYLLTHVITLDPNKKNVTVSELDKKLVLKIEIEKPKNIPQNSPKNYTENNLNSTVKLIQRLGDTVAGSITPNKQGNLKVRLITEECPGISLRKFMQEDKFKSLSIPDKMTIMSSLLIELKKFHEAGVIHGDLHPGNILIDPETLKVSIIDLSAPISGEIGQKVARPGHMAYHSYIAKNKLMFDPAMDMSAMGLLFYEMFCYEKSKNAWPKIWWDTLSYTNKRISQIYTNAIADARQEIDPKSSRGKDFEFAEIKSLDIEGDYTQEYKSKIVALMNKLISSKYKGADNIEDILAEIENLSNLANENISNSDVNVNPPSENVKTTYADKDLIDLNAKPNAGDDLYAVAEGDNEKNLDEDAHFYSAALDNNLNTSNKDDHLYAVEEEDNETFSSEDDHLYAIDLDNNISASNKDEDLYAVEEADNETFSSEDDHLYAIDLDNSISASNEDEHQYAVKVADHEKINNEHLENSPEENNHNHVEENPTEIALKSQVNDAQNTHSTSQLTSAENIKNNALVSEIKVKLKLLNEKSNDKENTSIIPEIYINKKLYLKNIHDEINGIIDNEKNINIETSNKLISLIDTVSNLNDKVSYSNIKKYEKAANQFNKLKQVENKNLNKSLFAFGCLTYLDIAISLTVKTLGLFPLVTILQKAAINSIGAILRGNVDKKTTPKNNENTDYQKQKSKNLFNFWKKEPIKPNDMQNTNEQHSNKAKFMK